MRALVLIGLSHKSAGIGLMERFSSFGGGDALARDLCGLFRESLSLSTCNRTEVYLFAPDFEDKRDALLELFERYSRLDRAEFLPSLYVKSSLACVRHLFRVICSLDSAVLGENEIVGQVRASFKGASEAGHLGPILDRLFAAALSLSRRVRTETQISANPLSLPLIALRAAAEMGVVSADSSVLLVGAGQVANSCLKALQSFGFAELNVVNRSWQSAQRMLDNFNLRAGVFGLGDLPQLAAKSDILLSAVSVKDYVLGASSFVSAGSRGSFMADFSLPRSLDPALASLGGVTLLNLEDLKGIALENRAKRLGELESVNTHIDFAIDSYLQWFNSLSLVPLIKERKRELNSIGDKELSLFRRHSLKCLSQEQFSAVERLAGRILAKAFNMDLMAIKGARRVPYGVD